MPVRSGDSPASAVRPVQPVRHQFEDDGAIPNSRLPFLVYPGALELSGRDPAAVCVAVFAASSSRCPFGSKK